MAGGKSVGALISVGVLVTVCGFGMCAYRRDQQRYAGLERACDGQPVPGAASFVPGGAARLLAYTHNSTAGWTWGLTLTPNAYRAASRQEASLVLCAEEPRRVVVGRCEVSTTGGPGIGVRVLGVRVATIGANGGTATYNQTQTQLPVRLVDAATGLVRINDVIVGDAPRSCENVTQHPSASDYEGGDVGSEQLRAWLATRLVTGQ